MLRGVTSGCKGLQAVARVATGCEVLRGVARGCKGWRGVARGCEGLRGVARGKLTSWVPSSKPGCVAYFLIACLALEAFWREMYNLS